MSYRRFVPQQPYALRLKGRTSAFARIAGAQLDDLLDLLVEDAAGDRDYFIDTATLNYLERQGADTELLKVLIRQVGTSSGIEIEWVRIEEEGGE